MMDNITDFRHESNGMVRGECPGPLSPFCCRPPMQVCYEDDY